MTSEVPNWDPRVDDFNDQNYSTVRGGPASSYTRHQHADKLGQSFALHIINIPCGMSKADLANYLTVQNVVVLDVFMLPKKENYKSNHAIVKVEDTKQGLFVVETFDKKPPLCLGISKARDSKKDRDNNINDRQGGFQPMQPTPMVDPSQSQPQFKKRSNMIFSDKKNIEYSNNSALTITERSPLSNVNNSPSQNDLIPPPVTAAPHTKPLSVESVKIYSDEKNLDYINNSTHPITERTHLSNVNKSPSPKDLIPPPVPAALHTKSLSIESVKENLEKRFNNMHIQNELRRPMDSAAKVATHSAAGSTCSSSSSKKSKRIMKCIFCGENGSLRCCICFAYYCSHSCQRDDWHGHQSICRSPPQLLPCTAQLNGSCDLSQSVSNVLENVRAPSPSVQVTPPNELANVSVGSASVLQLPSPKALVEALAKDVELKKFHFNRLHKFPLELKCYQVEPQYCNEDLFVRLSTDEIKEDVDKFFALSKAFFEKAANPIPTELVPGELFCVYDPSDQNYYRAQVLKTKADKIFAYYVDYGQTDIVNMENARIFDASFLQMPVACFRLRNLKSSDGVHSVHSVCDDLLYFTMRVLATEPLLTVDLINFDGLPLLSSSATAASGTPVRCPANRLPASPSNAAVRQNDIAARSTSRTASSEKASVPTSTTTCVVAEKAVVPAPPSSCIVSETGFIPTSSTAVSEKALIPTVSEKAVLPTPVSPDHVSSSSEDNKGLELYTSTYGEMSTLSLPLEKEVTVLVLFNESLPVFSAIPVSDCALLEKLAKMSEEMQEYCNKTATFYKPKEDEIVLARYDNDEQWYRAAVLDILEDGAGVQVVFLDYGNMTTVVNFSEFCPMIRKFMDLPALALTCHIADYPPILTDAQTATLQEATSDELTLDVKSFEDFMYTVSIPSLSDMFQKLAN